MGGQQIFRAGRPLGVLPVGDVHEEKDLVHRQVVVQVPDHRHHREELLEAGVPRVVQDQSVKCLSPTIGEVEPVVLVHDVGVPVVDRAQGNRPDII